MLTLLKDNFVTSTNFHSVSDNDYYILRGHQDDLYYTVLYIKDFEPNRDVIKELEKIKIKYNIIYSYFKRIMKKIYLLILIIIYMSLKI